MGAYKQLSAGGDGCAAGCCGEVGLPEGGLCCVAACTSRSLSPPATLFPLSRKMNDVRGINFDIQRSFMPEGECRYLGPTPCRQDRGHSRRRQAAAVCPLACPPASLPAYPPACPACRPACLSVCLSICLSACLFVAWSHRLHLPPSPLRPLASHGAEPCPVTPVLPCCCCPCLAHPPASMGACQQHLQSHYPLCVCWCAFFLLQMLMDRYRTLESD